MKIVVRHGIAVSVAIGMVVGIVGVGAYGVAASPPPATAKAPVKLVHSAKLGMIMTNSKGMTLYYFKSDTAGKPTCTGACAQTWPPALKSASARFAKLPVPGKFGTVATPSGGRQITYNGWPLYTFVGDKKPGQTTGQGVNNFFVATPKLKRAAGSHSSAPPAAAPTCTPSAYGC